MIERIKLFCVPVVLLFIVSIACEQESAPVASLENLELRFLSVSIWANLGPVIPPDPVRCHLDMEIQNTSCDQTFDGLYVPNATVYIDSTGELLGEIQLTTLWDTPDWDGHLEPGELDTVRLMKISMNTRPFEPPCNAEVYLKIWVRESSDQSIAFTTDSTSFDCWE
ncbi:MAG: hypothetical protein ACETWG_00575 [Candidatus Neomarinimicrobiota bacterium]